MKKGKIIAIVLLGALIVFVGYEAVCIIVTHDVVNEVETVIKGEKDINDLTNPFYRFSKTTGYDNVSDVKGGLWQILTVCGKNKGRIYILYWAKYTDVNGENIFDGESGAILYIEKIDGEWVLTGSYEHP